MDSSVLEVPGKIFLIGEYLAIETGKCVVEALKPPYRFECGEQVQEPLPHPESPAGTLLREWRQECAPYRVLPDSAPAGFGGSTAECLVAWRSVHGRWPATDEVVSWYRERFPVASGMDLKVQSDAIAGALRRGPIPEVYSRLWILERQNPDKRATHEDLGLVRPPLIQGPLSDLVVAFQNGLTSTAEFDLGILDAYADALSLQGRETAGARGLRESLRKLPGVQGVKGCGAGLHDAFLLGLAPGCSLSSLLPSLGNLGLRVSGSLEERLW
jgi:hypothetical protein